MPFKASTQTSIKTHTQRQIPEEFILLPRGEGFGFFPFLLCRAHGPASAPLVLVCLSFSFCRPSWQHVSKTLSLSPPEASMSTETQRKRQHAIDLLLKSLFEKMPTISSFFLQSSGVPQPCWVDGTLFAHLGCFSSYLISKRCLPRSCRGSVFRFFLYWEGRAMTLLVTSDTTQPPPVDQMGRKCKRATSGWEGEKRPLTNIKPPCDLPGLSLLTVTLWFSSHTHIKWNYWSENHSPEMSHPLSSIFLF